MKDSSYIIKLSTYTLIYCLGLFVLSCIGHQFNRIISESLHKGIVEHYVAENSLNPIKISYEKGGRQNETYIYDYRLDAPSRVVDMRLYVNMYGRPMIHTMTQRKEQ